jgi:hypothetical protein
MFGRLRAAVLLAVMLLASLAPTAAVCLHGTGAEAMTCCAGAEDCGRPALQRACCPCAAPAPADPPAAARALHASPQIVAPASWLASPAAHPGAIAPGEGRAFGRLVAIAAPSPPWLLNGAFLI